MSISSLFNGKCGTGSDPPGELAAPTASSNLASSSFWSDVFVFLTLVRGVANLKVTFTHR
jgi:hypothetical protein